MGKRKKPVPTKVALERLLKASGGLPPKGATDRVKKMIAAERLARGDNIGIEGERARQRRNEKILDAVDRPKRKRK